MDISVTKRTAERYNLDSRIKLDTKITASVGNSNTNDIFSWGAKVFYIQGKKSLQIMNMASKLTFVIIDIANKDLEEINELIYAYMIELMWDDASIRDFIQQYINDDSEKKLNFYYLKERSTISSLNYTQRTLLDDPEFIYSFVKDGILNVSEMNYYLNREYLVTIPIDGKKEYYYACEYFKDLLVLKYCPYLTVT